MNPIVMTVAQASEFLALSRATLYRHIANGRLLSIQLGGRRMFRVCDLERFVNEAPEK